LNALRNFGYHVDVHDARAHLSEAKKYLNEDLIPSLENLQAYDCVLGAVSHHYYVNLTSDFLVKLLKPQSLLVDLKNMWKHLKLPEGIQYWTL
jgi:UDP-N-acetyl-D-galactosamine dehydrogenase